jgi:hypothetical protein
VIFGAESLRLLPKSIHQLWAHDSFGEAWVIFDVRRDHQLTTWLNPVDDQRFEISAGRIKSSS